jgi:hypothetical protein
MEQEPQCRCGHGYSHHRELGYRCNHCLCGQFIDARLPPPKVEDHWDEAWDAFTDPRDESPSPDIRREPTDD